MTRKEEILSGFKEILFTKFQDYRYFNNIIEELFGVYNSGTDSYIDFSPTLPQRFLKEYERLLATKAKVRGFEAGEETIHLNTKERSVIPEGCTTKMYLNKHGEPSFYIGESGRRICIYKNGKWAENIP